MNSSPYFLQTSLVFAWCPFLFPDPTLHTSLGSSRLWQLLRLSLFSLTFVRGTGQVFWRMFLNWDLPDVSLMMRLGVWVLGSRMTEVKSIFIPSFEGACSHRDITIDADLDYLDKGKACQVSSIVKWLLFPLFRIVLFEKKSLCAAQT